MVLRDGVVRVPVPEMCSQVRSVPKQGSVRPLNPPALDLLA
jgi:hypothetical protein